ncbi:MAG: PspC domain-containing protein [Sphingobacteriaceae bacterium]|nr:MAG: PspC domain-containing protein [Sphingobacteriaceae bacterium]
MEKKLYRDEYRKEIAGVCAGLSDHLGMDVSILRIIFLLTAIFLHGTGLVVYVVLWIALPAKNPYLHGGPEADYTVPPSDPFNPFKNATPPNFTMPNYDKPFGNVPAKKNTKVGVILGAILIVLGIVFLLNNFNLIPDVDFDIVWPLIFVAIGVAFILSGRKKQPWEKQKWETATPAPETEPEVKKEESAIDNPPTV